jgi:hypothetical protein
MAKKRDRLIGKFVPEFPNRFSISDVCITGNYTQATAKADRPSDEDIHDLSDPEAFGFSIVNHLIS